MSPFASDARPCRAQRIQRMRRPEDLDAIAFTDGLAALTVPFELLDHVRFKNDVREPSPRLAAVANSIRRNGFLPRDPIICRIGQKGRWVVVDGGHRLTAARMVAREFWPNLFGRRVRDLYFVLFTGPRSWRKVKRIAKAEKGRAPGPASALPDEPPEDAPEAEPAPSQGVRRP